MIICYTGRCGCGKTLTAVKKIYSFLKSGKLVITNISLPDCFEFCNYIYITDIELRDARAIYTSISSYYKVTDFSSCSEGSVVLFVDEASIPYYNRDWNALGREELLTFFSQHRKLKADVYLICQSADTIDKHIASKIDVIYDFRRFLWGKWGVISGVVKFDPFLSSGSRHFRLGFGFKFISSSYYKKYNSYQEYSMLDWDCPNKYSHLLYNSDKPFYCSSSFSFFKKLLQK